MKRFKPQQETKQPNKMKRYSPSADTGLTSQQVKERMDEHLNNIDSAPPSKSVALIIRDNVCTLFNFIIAALGVAVLCVGSYKNLLFVGIMLCNIVIGIIQEIRSKRTVDRLSLLSASKARVIRNGNQSEIPIDEIVLDDVLVLRNGDQITTDCILLDGACSVNESLITGEPDAILKKQGDALLSGSFIVSGSCRAQVEHVGAENYAARITNGVKYIKKSKSEIMLSLRKIIRIVSILIFPIGIFLFLNQFAVQDISLQQAVVSTTAALTGMIPEGLVLLTSSVLAVSVIRLSRYKVMVEDLYSIEALARVDVLCLDKTGTITEGSMELHRIEPLNKTPLQEIETVLTNLCAALDDQSPTFQAIASQYTGSCDWKMSDAVPFSSERKWSGASFQAKGTYLLGAPEFILGKAPLTFQAQLDAALEENRVLLLAHSAQSLSGPNLPKGIQPIALLLIRDIIRADARETMGYFANQGVALKVISGDNPLTVKTIAQRVGIKNADRSIDATELRSKQELYDAVEKYTVFGRVTPEQKKEMVLALQKQNHTVAMTGDGVNDVLALKEADCSVAMASGCDAARNVSKLVLLNSDFSAMPYVVREGRRSINNIQRSASIFIVKTIYSIVIALFFLFAHFPYPFIPIQMTLISSLTIGFPSFVLALEANNRRVQGNFLKNIFVKALPGALTILIGILLVTLLSPVLGLSSTQLSTLCVILTGFTGMLLIFRLSMPFNILRRILFGIISVGFTVCILFFRPLFSLADFTPYLVLLTFLTMTFCFLLFSIFLHLFHEDWRKGKPKTKHIFK